MPIKRKRTTKVPPPAQRRAATPQERGDTDYRGDGGSYAADNLPRKPVAGQRREPPAATARPQPVRTRGVDDRGAAGLSPDDAKAFHLASLRARRRGLH